jgi:predicted nucleic acid-binding protein
VGSKDNHFNLYKKFKNDAENINNFEGTRVDAYFLSAYHSIEACTAQERVHINKHQLVRSVLIKNNFIFKDDTEEIWENFQKIENQLRPKFAYGFSWTNTDMKNVEVCYKKIEIICLKKLN